MTWPWGFGGEGLIINGKGDMIGEYLLDIIFKFWYDVGTLRQKTPNLGWANFFWNSCAESPYFDKIFVLVVFRSLGRYAMQYKCKIPKLREDFCLGYTALSLTSRRL